MKKLTLLNRISLRNLESLIRNKQAILMPLIPLGIILIVFLFLRGNYLMPLLESALFTSAELSARAKFMFIDNWFASNFLIFATFAFTLIAGVQRVEDRQYSQLRDLPGTPVSPLMLKCSYPLSSAFIGLFIGAAAFMIGLSVLGITDKFYFSLGEVMLALLAIVITAVLTSIFASIIASIIKSSQIYYAVSAVISLFVAFTSGIIVPLNTLSPDIARLFVHMPFTDAVALFRAACFDNNIVNIMQANSADMSDVYMAFDAALVFDNRPLPLEEIILIPVIAILISAFVYFSLSALPSILRRIKLKYLDDEIK